MYFTGEVNLIEMVFRKKQESWPQGKQKNINH